MTTVAPQACKGTDIVKIVMDCGCAVRHMPVITSVWPKGQRPRYINRKRLNPEPLTAAQEAHDIVCPCGGRQLDITIVPRGTIARLAPAANRQMATTLEAHTGTGLPPTPRLTDTTSPKLTDTTIVHQAMADWIEIHRAMILQDKAARLPGGTWKVTDTIVSLPNTCSGDACTATAGSGCRHIWAVRFHVVTAQAGKTGADEDKARRYRRARQALLKTREDADWLRFPAQLVVLKALVRQLWPTPRQMVPTPREAAETPETPETSEQDETETSEQAPATLTSLINLNTASTAAALAAVNIGRNGKWGNPFLIGRDGTRTETVRKYAEAIQEDPHFLDGIEELQGRALGCYCAPRTCHGDLLVEIADAPKKDWGSIVARYATLPEPAKTLTRSKTRVAGIAEAPPLPGLASYL